MQVTYSFALPSFTCMRFTGIYFAIASQNKKVRASAFVINRVKTSPTSRLITIQNLVVVSHTVGAHVGDPKNLSKIANVSLPVYLAPPLKGLPLEFCNGGIAHKKN